MGKYLTTPHVTAPTWKGNLPFTNPSPIATLAPFHGLFNSLPIACEISQSELACKTVSLVIQSHLTSAQHLAANAQLSPFQGHLWLTRLALLPSWRQEPHVWPDHANHGAEVPRGASQRTAQGSHRACPVSLWSSAVGRCTVNDHAEGKLC